jgi:DNA-binding winged helix-turn-helix (wHTH) protein/Tfp pilus assembly protein PilF
MESVCGLWHGMDDRKHRASSVTPGRLRFGTFEVNLELRELRKQGIRIKLPHKPFQVLEILLKKPGLLVRREELMQQLWPNLHVNFEGGLNTAINTLREALGDSPRNCRFIETLPGLGYRFLMPVEVMAHTEPSIGNTNGHASGGIVPFEAEQDYLKGKFFYNKLNEDDLRKSIAFFESAIAQDPSSACAYAALADAYCLGALLGIMSPDDAQRRARKLIMSALRIDHTLPEVRNSLAGIKRLFDRDWQSAEAECLEALQRNPNHAGSHQAYATLLAITGRVQEALKEIRRAQTLDPLSLLISTEMAGILCLAHDFSGAIEQSWKALVLDP